MLVLSRNPGQKLIFGDNREIEVTVLSVSGDQVRIGIEAPKDISVNREEIFNKIQKEKLAAQA